MAAWIVLQGPSVGDDAGAGALMEHVHASLPVVASTKASVSGPGATVVVVVGAAVVVVVAETAVPVEDSVAMKTSLTPLEAMVDVPEPGSKSAELVKVPDSKTRPDAPTAMPLGAT